ncbi:MAG: hypothetical protein Q8P56_03875 [Candidatus Uhrbacteria bacterium]|nr:hypothetical protein [Candidatus Uhrbacteria bacterium]
MTAEHANSSTEISPILFGVFSDPASLNALLDENENGVRVIQSLAAGILDDPQKQKELLTSLFSVLSREGGLEETNQRDAALFIIKSPLLKGLILKHSDSVYNAFCGAIEQQSNQNTVQFGSVGAVLDAGMIIAPYLRLSVQQKKGFRALGEKLAHKFTSSFDTRTHIQTQFERIRERLSPNPELDLLVEGILRSSNQDIGAVQIARDHDLDSDAVRKSVHRIIAQGRIRKWSARSEEEEERWRKLKREVKRLRKNNIRNKVIAKLLDEPYRDVTTAVSELLAQGEIEKSPREIWPRGQVSDIDSEKHTPEE